MCVRYKVMVKVLVKDNNGFVVGVEYLTVEGMRYCIKTITGHVIWFKTRDERDEKFLQLQEY